MGMVVGGRGRPMGAFTITQCLEGKDFWLATHLLNIPQQPPLRWGLLFDMIQIFFKQSASISGAKTRLFSVRSCQRVQ